MNIKLLNSFLDYLNWRYDINSGGCCFVAYCVAKNLEDRHISFEVVINNERTKEKLTPDYCINNSISANHVFIKCSEGFINKGNYSVKKNMFVKLSSSELYNYYKSSQWNTYYKKRNNRSINQLINKFFKIL